MKKITSILGLFLLIIAITSFVYNLFIDKNKYELEISSNINNCSGNAELYINSLVKPPVTSEIHCGRDNVLSFSLNENVEFLNKAVGAEDGKGSIYHTKFGNNAYRIDKNEEGDINIISVNSILKNLEEDIIPFIIKIDIEGFENELFSKNTEWIDSFPVIIIELHDWMLPKICNSANFLSSISKKNRDFLYSGENIFSIKNELNGKIQNNNNN